MNTEKLKEMIVEKADDSRAMFYLGNTLLEAREYQKALDAFDQYLVVHKNDDSEKYQVLMHKSVCHKELDQFADARNSLYLAMGIEYKRRDAFAMMGDVYYKMGRVEDAVQMYKDCLTKKPEPSRMFQNGPALTYDCYWKLAVLHGSIKDYPKAIYYMNRALRYWQNPEWIAKLNEWNNGKHKILVVDEIGSFTSDFIEHLKANKEYEVIVSHYAGADMISWADRVFVEWGSQQAEILSKQIPERTVIRIHGYEAYTGACRNIDFSKIRGVIFVAKHIMEMCIERFNISRDKCSVVSNGVNLDKFFITSECDNKTIGYAGYMNEKKNPFLLLQLIKENPDYTFHLRIDFQSPFWKDTFDFELADCKNVVYHGRYKDLNDFWNKVDNVVSTSIIESFSFNVAEAMACGCRPLIYNWRGAKDIWDNKWIFKDNKGFKKMLKSKADSQSTYRDYIKTNYPVEKTNKEMEVILNGTN